MYEPIFDHDIVIFREMMSHPVLFTHPQPKKVAILGDADNHILHEVLKHAHLQELHHTHHPHALVDENHAKIIFHPMSNTSWLPQIAPDTLDIVINVVDFNQDALPSFWHVLHPQGILVQQGVSPFDTQKLKTMVAAFTQAGFKDIQVIHFPQPGFSTGWRFAIMGLKQGAFKQIREKAIYNRAFKTHYYNFDIHKAALVLPEFVREECAI